MSHKEPIDGESRITLTLSGLWVVISAVAVCVSTVIGTYYKVSQKLTDIQSVIKIGRAHV